MYHIQVVITAKKEKCRTVGENNQGFQPKLARQAFSRLEILNYI